MTHAITPYAGNTFNPQADARGYIERVHQFTPLNAEEEQSLAREFIENDNLKAAQQLVMSNLRYVVPVARKYLGYGLPLGDLIQEGNVGLMKAVKRFDPAQGVRLMTFAVHWIKAEIHDFVIKNWRIVKMATTKAQRKLFFKLRGEKSELGSLNPSEAQRIADKLDVSTQDVLSMDARFHLPDMSLETPHDDDESASPLAIPSQDLTPEESLIQETESRRHRQLMTQAIANLDERSQDIIRSRWLDEDNKVTLKALAEKYHVSLERIRQIEKKALQDMKTAFMPA